MGAGFDAIVVGARCAGAPTAMLLARQGQRVLLVDRATFPSDTVATHFIHAPGVAALERWGLRDALAATGCPAIRRYSFDFGPFTIDGTPRGAGQTDEAYCPRRTVLDALLVEAAAAAGAEVREGFAVDEVLVEDGTVVGIAGRSAGGGSVTERATIVIGADGRNSMVAKAVQAERYNERPAVTPAYYSYWSGVGSAGFEVFIRDRCGMAAFPTHDDLTLVIAGLPEEDLEGRRQDVEGTFMSTIDTEPAFAERVHAGTRVERFHTSPALAGYFRTPYGPGWALVGDAGYHLHPITAQGITDAFLDAERLAGALGDVVAGRAAFDDAMAACQARRDADVTPMYEMTFDFAQVDQPPPPETQQLLGAVAGNQAAMDDFVSIQAGTLAVADFFHPDNVGRIMAAAR